jgi:hypothetical protein
MPGDEWERQVLSARRAPRAHYYWLLVVMFAGLLSACGGSDRAGYLPANTSVDPYASLRARADDYYRQGLEAYRQGEYRKALDAFQRAKLHDPSPRPETDEMIRRSQEALASNRPTGSPAATGSATPVASPTPLTSTSMLAFNSRVYPYAITYPPGWRAEGASERIGGTLFDRYREENDGGASALVFNFKPNDGSSQDGLVRQSLAMRQKEGTPWRRLGVRPVEDAQAVVVTYSEQRSDGAWLAVRQAVFQRGGTCWVVAVTAPLPDAPRYAPVLDQMLDGFRINPATRP